MKATAILILFIFMINKIKTKSIRVIKDGKISGVFVLIAIKMLFWLCIVEIAYIWLGSNVIFILPVVLLLFTSYILMERKLIIEAVLRKKVIKSNEKTTKLSKISLFKSKRSAKQNK